MNISKYCSYFHDGSIINIEQTENTILISMDSADIDMEEKIDIFELSDHNSIKGILHLKNIQSVNVNDEMIYEQLYMLADTATILDLDITDNSMHMFIKWRNFLPKPKIEEYSDIKITCEKIYWENLPDLFDPFR